MSWPEVKLKDVCDVLVDCRNKTAPYEGDGIPLIRTTNFRENALKLASVKYVSEATNEIWSSRHQTSPGDVVYCREAPFGMAAIVPEGFYPCLGQRIMVARPNKERVTSKFLWFALNSPQVYQQAKRVAVGATVKHLRVRDVEALEIPLPPLPEQKRGISYGVVQRGAHRDDGVPITRISNIAKNVFDTSNFVRADSTITDKFKRTELRGGEMAVSIRGTCGRVAVVPTEAAGWNVSREVAVIPLLPGTDAEFVQRVILSPGGQRFILGNVKGVAQSAINLADLRNLPVLVPPEKEIKRFKRPISVQKIALRKLTESQGSLLSKSLTRSAFRGEL